MYDLKVIYVRDVVKVLRATLLTKDPPTLQLTGRNFTGAEIVLINGVTAPEFTIQSKTTLTVVIPESLRTTTPRTIDVYAGTFTATERSFLEPVISPMPQWTTGIYKLVQQFVKVLLTTPGTSLFRPEEGGGLQQLIGVPFSADDARQLASKSLAAVSRAEDQVRTSQSRRGVPASERLRAVTVEDVTFDPDTGGLLVQVALESEAGQMAVANLGLSAVPATS